MGLILLYPYQIIGRERLNGQYGAGVFVVGNTRSSIRCLLIISLIPGAIASFLYHWPSKEFGTLCLLCSATLRVHDAG